MYILLTLTLTAAVLLHGVFYFLIEMTLTLTFTLSCFRFFQLFDGEAQNSLVDGFCRFTATSIHEETIKLTNITGMTNKYL